MIFNGDFFSLIMQKIVEINLSLCLIIKQKNKIMTNIIDVEDKIITVRDQQVILDADVAELYGVETKRINEAVANNPDKFPDGYVFQLDNQEIAFLRSKFSTLEKKGRGHYSKYSPKAFTEKGLYMLATILKSKRAVETTIAIVEAYAKLKELSRVIVTVPEVEEGSEIQKSLLHRGGRLVEEIMDDVLPKQSTETFVELNLAMLKFKHSVKKEKDEQLKRLENKISELEEKLRKLE